MILYKTHFKSNAALSTGDKAEITRLKVSLGVWHIQEIPKICSDLYLCNICKVFKTLSKGPNYLL